MSDPHHTAPPSLFMHPSYSSSSSSYPIFTKFEARAGITEVHFLPFNPVDKRTAITYIDNNGNWHRVSKGAPEQIIELCKVKEDVRNKVHSIIDKFADRGLRSLAVVQQVKRHQLKV